MRETVNEILAWVWNLAGSIYSAIETFAETTILPPLKTLVENHIAPYIGRNLQETAGNLWELYLTLWNTDMFLAGAVGLGFLLLIGVFIGLTIITIGAVNNYLRARRWSLVVKLAQELSSHAVATNQLNLKKLRNHPPMVQALVLRELTKVLDIKQESLIALAKSGGLDKWVGTNLAKTHVKDRIQAAQTLLMLNQPLPVRLLNDPSKEIQTIAVASWRNIKTPSSKQIEAMLEKLQDPNGIVRTAARSVLEAWGSKAAYGVLLASWGLLNRSDLYTGKREARTLVLELLKTLGGMDLNEVKKNPELKNLLEKTLKEASKHGDEAVRCAVSYTLQNAEMLTQVELHKDLHPAVRVYWCQAGANAHTIEAEETRKLLLHLTENDPDLRVRRSAARAEAKLATVIKYRENFVNKPRKAATWV